MNLSSLQTEISRKLGDISQDRWNATILTARINHIIRDIVLRTKCLRETGTDSVVAGTQEYALPSGYIDMIRVTLDGEELVYVDKKELDMESGIDWTTKSGTPTRYYIDIDPDNSRVGLVPNPDASGSSNLKYFFVKNPTDLSGSTDIPFNNDTVTTSNLLVPHHMTIVYGAAAMCLEDSISDPGTIAKLNEYLSKYEEGIRKIYDIFNNPTDRLWTMKGGRNWGQSAVRLIWNE